MEDFQEKLYNETLENCIEFYMDEMGCSMWAAQEAALQDIKHTEVDYLLYLLGFSDIYEYLEANAMTLSDVIVSPTGMNKGRGLLV